MRSDSGPEIVGNIIFETSPKCEVKVEVGEPKIIKEEINHPSHYNQGKFEVIEIIDAFNLDFYEGSIIKYLLRYKFKNGTKDLKKAQWYLNRLIEKEEKNECK